MRTWVGWMFRTAFVMAVAWMSICAGVMFAQTSAADTEAVGPAFEVAAVRPSSSDGSGGFGMAVEPSGRFKVHAETANFLFWQAYSDGPGKRNVIMDRGAPKWVESETFDINAKVDVAAIRGWETMSSEQRMELVRPMLRRLLADRFHIKFRVEMRPTPVYALVQAKGGAHVKEVPAPPQVQGDPEEAMTKWMAEHPGEVSPGSISCSGDKCMGHAVKISGAMGQIQGSSEADRMVVDETGLNGYYDFSFRGFLPHDGDESSMQAVEDDLGVKFVPRSMPIKTYVIVSAEKPSLDGD